MKFPSKICLLGLFSTIVLFGCDDGKPVAGRPPTPVVVAKVTMQEVPLYIDTIGVCVASEAVDVVAQVGGKITSVNFEQGQQVSAGDHLFSIDRRIYEVNLRKAEAQLDMAKVKMQLDAAQLERSRALLPQNYISQQQYEVYESQVEQDKINVELAAAQVEQAKIDLDYCDVVSPIDGIAGAYLIDVGNVVGSGLTGTNRALVSVQNIDPLYVEFSVSENNFHELQKYFSVSDQNLSVEVSPIANDDIKGHANISFINNAINRKTGAIKLRALMDNMEHKFWPGMSVRVRVLLSVLDNAVLVPAEAVKLGQRGHYVFVVNDDSSVELRFVTVGQLHGDMLVVTDGLSCGDTVVQRGQLMLAPGMKVVALPNVDNDLFEQNLEKNKRTAEKNPTTR